MRNLFLAATLVLSFQSANAQDVQCEISHAVRCPCPASMAVTCPNGVRGNIDNKAPVKAVTVSYKDSNGTSHTVTLQNPPGGARDFYAASYNDWIKSQLPAGAVDISGESLTLDSATPLYDDPGNFGEPLSGAVVTVSGDRPSQSSQDSSQSSGGPLKVSVCKKVSMDRAGDVTCYRQESVTACESLASSHKCQWVEIEAEGKCKTTTTLRGMSPCPGLDKDQCSSENFCEWVPGQSSDGTPAGPPPACEYLTNSYDFKSYLTFQGNTCSREPMKVCFAEMNCIRGFDYAGGTAPAGQYEVYCKTDASGKCPSNPIDCASDPTIDDLKADGNRFMEVGEDASISRDVRR